MEGWIEFGEQAPPFEVRWQGSMTLTGVPQATD